jgi:hypothetical protein
MTDPTPERIAAALALAEAVDAYYTKATDERAKAHQTALAAYRATAPKLRTRAEVDAEIVAKVREHSRLWPEHGPDDPRAAGARWAAIQALCREQTAPEPDRIGAPYGFSKTSGALHALERDPVCRERNQRCWLKPKP